MNITTHSADDDYDDFAWTIWMLLLLALFCTPVIWYVPRRRVVAVPAAPAPAAAAAPASSAAAEVAPLLSLKA
jgi:hypothetical protein